MNKFNFLIGTQQVNCCQSDAFFENFTRNFQFKFEAQNHHFDIISRLNSISQPNETDQSNEPRFERTTRAPGSIVKTDIRENVIKQLKEMLLIVRQEKELLYLKMSKETKDRFRIYYNYEVSYPPRQLSNEDRQVGKIVGCIMGVKIVQDDTLKLDIVQPIVRSLTVKTKFQRVFNNKLKEIV